tara:strand:- start:361 stop:627 length:267 start_codon:yes stop_codon:yes gene_type:complete
VGQDDVVRLVSLLADEVGHRLCLIHVVSAVDGDSPTFADHDAILPIDKPTGNTKHLWSFFSEHRTLTNKKARRSTRAGLGPIHIKPSP